MHKLGEKVDTDIMAIQVLTQTFLYSLVSQAYPHKASNQPLSHDYLTFTKGIQ